MAGPRRRSAAGAQRLYAVCLIHLIICVVLVVLATPGLKPLAVGGLEIYHSLQCINGAVCCISIVFIIAATIGNLYCIESHIAAYFYVLLVSLLFDIGWLAMFLALGQSCTRPVASEGALVQCTFMAGKPVVFLTLCIIFKGFGMLSAVQAQKLVRLRYNEELLPYLKEALGQSCSSRSSSRHAGAEEAPLLFPAAAAPTAPPAAAPVARSLSFRAAGAPAEGALSNYGSLASCRSAGGLAGMSPQARLLEESSTISPSATVLHA